MLKKETALSLIHSLLDIGEFVGLSESAKATLSSALGELSSEGVDVSGHLERKLKITEFKKDIYESRAVVFEVLVEHENASKGGFTPVGPLTNIRVLHGEPVERNLGLGVGLPPEPIETTKQFARLFLFCDIDHDLALLIEGNQDVLKGLKETITINAPYPVEILNKQFI